MTINNISSELTEQELFKILIMATPEPIGNLRNKRIAGLEELQRRILANSLQDWGSAILTLLSMSKSLGNIQPDSSLLIDCFILLIEKYEGAFKTILNGLEGKEGPLFICFSRVVLSLKDWKKKKTAIPYLADFLMSRDDLTCANTREVYECLVSLGNEKLDQEIVKAVKPFLNSSSAQICPIIYSLRLCSKFANNKLLPEMKNLLDKSIKGYFPQHKHEIEKDICQYLERIKELNSLPILSHLLKVRTGYVHDHITRAIARILDDHPSSTEHLLELIYDYRKKARIICVILECFTEMQEPRIPVQKILKNIRLNWWKESYLELQSALHSLFVKMGEFSKPSLFEILKDVKKYDFTLSCLKEIGVSYEELSTIFPTPPMLMIYNFLYSQQKKKIPKDLISLWNEKDKLTDYLPGATDKLEHLILHIFSSLNFVTINIASLQIESVDVVCFHPETLDLYIIGCTTGTIQDDLKKIQSLVSKMENEVPELFQKCSITPIIASSEFGDIHPSDDKYSAKHGILIVQREEIDTLLEMLITDRPSREVIEYIKSLKEELQSRST